MKLFQRLFVLGLATLLPSPAWSAEAAQSAAAPKFLRIPVYFATDRNVVDSPANRPEFGNQRQYIGHCKHDYHLGGAFIDILNTENKPLTPELLKLGWKAADAKEEGYESGSVLPNEPDQAAAKEKFLAKLVADESTTPNHQFLMFVPGYMSTFDSGLISTARFAYFSERPVVLYSWASKGEFKAYSSDEATIEWCQYHFNDFLRAIKSMTALDPAVKIRLVAHSMGTRLAVRASSEFRNTPMCSEVDLVCPDTDDGVVKHYMDDNTIFKVGQGAPIVRLYMSRKDKMLTLSQAVHGGYARFGEQADNDPQSVKKGESEDLSAPVSQDDAQAAAEEPSDADDTNKDSKEAKDAGPTSRPNRNSPATNLSTVENRFQTIDFTSIDTGKLGHKIPVKIMCNITNSGEPGGNWKLVYATNFSGNAGSRLIDKATDLHNSELKDADNGYFLLVSTLSPMHKPVRTFVSKHKLIPRRLKNKDWTLK